MSYATIVTNSNNDYVSKAELHESLCRFGTEMKTLIEESTTKSISKLTEQLTYLSNLIQGILPKKRSPATARSLTSLSDSGGCRTKKTKKKRKNDSPTNTAKDSESEQMWSDTLSQVSTTDRDPLATDSTNLYDTVKNRHRPNQNL